MARHVVFIWELGDNFGHVALFAGVARKLHQRGYELTAILRKLHDAPRFLGDLPVQLLQAPVAHKQPLGMKPQSYTDDIRNCGYLDAMALQGLLRGWKSLYELTKPDVVIFNAAPTAMAAARSERFKKIALGQGYEIPPRMEPLPAFLQSDEIDLPEILVRERQVLAVLNAALQDIGLAPYHHFHEVFEVDKTFLTGTRELDHYQQREGGCYIGPLFSIDGGTKIPWPRDDCKRIFAYLRSESSFFVSTLQALHAMSKTHAVLVSAPRISQKNLAHLNSNGLTVLADAVHLGSIRANCDLAICHAGVGTVTAFLHAGVPLLLLPTHVEQWLMANNVRRLGAGAIPKATPTQATVETAIRAMLATPSFRDKAQAYQSKYANVSNEEAENDLVGEIEALVTGSAG
jgi:UDP:flavonoid glycosyltransferase YjiC (YdhE family)